MPFYQLRLIFVCAPTNEGAKNIFKRCYKYFQHKISELGLAYNQMILLTFVDFRNNKCILTINVAIKKSMKKLLP